MAKRSKPKDMRIGQYIPVISGFNKQEWTIRLDKDAWFDCQEQVDAEILSHMVLIEQRLKRIEKYIKEAL